MLTPNVRPAFLSLTACLFLALAVPSPAQQKEAPAAAPAKELTYKVPKGWREVEAGQFTVARFQVSQGEETATGSVSSLRAPAGGMAANVNRWRGQIGLESLKEEEVMKAMKEIKVDGLRGHFTDLAGPRKDGKPAQQILGAIITRGDQVWFFKLMGPADLVARQKAAFDDFIRSVQFRRS